MCAYVNIICPPLLLTVLVSLRRQLDYQLFSTLSPSLFSPSFPLPPLPFSSPPSFFSPAQANATWCQTKSRWRNAWNPSLRNSTLVSSSTFRKLEGYPHPVAAWLMLHARPHPWKQTKKARTHAYTQCWMESIDGLASFPGSRFSSSVCVQYNTRKKRTQTEELKWGRPGNEAMDGLLF